MWSVHHYFESRLPEIDTLVRNQEVYLTFEPFNLLLYILQKYHFPHSNMTLKEEKVNAKLNQMLFQ